MVIPLIPANMTDPEYFSKFPLVKDLTNYFLDESYQGKIFFINYNNYYFFF